MGNLDSKKCSATNAFNNTTLPGNPSGLFNSSSTVPPTPSSGSDLEIIEWHVLDRKHHIPAILLGEPARILGNVGQVQVAALTLVAAGGRLAGSPALAKEALGVFPAGAMVEEGNDA